MTTRHVPLRYLNVGTSRPYTTGMGTADNMTTLGITPLTEEEFDELAGLQHDAQTALWYYNLELIGRAEKEIRTLRARVTELETQLRKAP